MTITTLVLILLISTTLAATVVAELSGELKLGWNSGTEKDINVVELFIGHFGVRTILFGLWNCGGSVDTVRIRLNPTSISNYGGPIETLQQLETNQHAIYAISKTGKPVKIKLTEMKITDKGSKSYMDCKFSEVSPDSLPVNVVAPITRLHQPPVFANAVLDGQLKLGWNNGTDTSPGIYQLYLGDFKAGSNLVRVTRNHKVEASYGGAAETLHMIQTNQPKHPIYVITEQGALVKVVLSEMQITDTGYYSYMDCKYAMPVSADEVKVRQQLGSGKQSQSRQTPELVGQLKLGWNNGTETKPRIYQLYIGDFIAGSNSVKITVNHDEKASYGGAADTLRKLKTNQEDYPIYVVNKDSTLVKVILTGIQISDIGYDSYMDCTYGKI